MSQIPEDIMKAAEAAALEAAKSYINPKKPVLLLNVEPIALAILAERQKNDAEWSGLVPLLDAGMFEHHEMVLCEKCGAPLVQYEEAAPVADFTGCWRAATGRDSDPCPGDGRKRISLMIKESLERFSAKSRVAKS